MFEKNQSSNFNYIEVVILTTLTNLITTMIVKVVIFTTLGDKLVMYTTPKIVDGILTETERDAVKKLMQDESSLKPLLVAIGQKSCPKISCRFGLMRSFYQ